MIWTTLVTQTVITSYRLRSYFYTLKWKSDFSYYFICGLLKIVLKRKNYFGQSVFTDLALYEQIF